MESEEEEGDDVIAELKQLLGHKNHGDAEHIEEYPVVYGKGRR